MGDLICMSIPSYEYLTHSWLVIPFKDVWVNDGLPQLSTCPSQLLLVLSFCPSRAHFGSDVLFVTSEVSSDTQDLPWDLVHLTAVWFYSVWRLLYQTYPKCPGWSWLNIADVRRLCSEPNSVLDCEKGRFSSSRCLHLSSHNCCCFHLASIFVESARTEWVLCIPGVFLPLKLDVVQQTEYFSFVYWTVVDSDSGIELRISGLGLTVAQLSLIDSCS